MTSLIVNPKRKVVVKPKVKAAPVDPISAMIAGLGDQSGIVKSANAVTSAKIAAEVAGTRAAYEQQRRDALAQQQRAQGFALALGNLTRPDPDAITGRYREAADRLRAYGTGLTGAVANAQQAEADRTRAAVESAIGSSNNVRGYDPEALRNAAQMMNIVNPGSTLESEAAAAGATAEYGRLAGTAGIADIANQYGQKVSGIDAEMADKVAAIEASRGSEFQDALKAAQDARRGDYSTLASLLNTQFNQKLAVAKLNQSQTQWLAKFKQDASQFGVRTALQQAGLQLGYAKLAQSTLNADRSYALALEGMGYKKQKAQLDALALETKLQNGGLTATTVNKLKGDANYIATTAFNGENEQGKKGKKLPIGQAMAWMRRGYTDKYGRTSGGVPPSIALEALRKAGYTVPRSWEQANLNSLTLGGQSPFQGAATSPANAVAQTAKAFLGVPYVWGGTSVTKGLDCSAFAQALLARLGVKIPRTTYTQFKAGTPVALAQLQPGDLVFTRPGSAGPNHVGVYIGNGQIQQSPHTGDVNKITPLSDFLTGGFVGARRYR